MKKIIITFLINLLIAISGFSQNIYPKPLNDSLVIITNDQLKQTNLIFLEHKKLKLENTEYLNKINLLDSLVVNNNKIDSLRLIEINQLKTDYKDLQKKCKSKTVKSYLIGGVGGIIIATIAALLIK